MKTITGIYHKVLTLAFCVLLTLFTNTAHSDHGLFYLVGGVGQVEVDTSTDGSPLFSGSVDEDTTTWSLGAGLNVNSYFSAEISYVDFDEFKWDGLWTGVSSVGTVESDGWEIAAIGKWPVSEEYGINLQAKIGYLFWDSEAKEVFGGTPEPDDSESGEDLMYGLGVQGKIIQNLDWRVEWTRYEVWDDDADAFTFELLYFPFGYGR